MKLCSKVLVLVEGGKSALQFTFKMVVAMATLFLATAALGLHTRMPRRSLRDLTGRHLNGIENLQVSVMAKQQPQLTQLKGSAHLSIARQ